MAGRGVPLTSTRTTIANTIKASTSTSRSSDMFVDGRTDGSTIAKQTPAAASGMNTRVSMTETPVTLASPANSLPQAAATAAASRANTQFGANHSAENTIAMMTIALRTRVIGGDARSSGLECGHGLRRHGAV